MFTFTKEERLCRKSYLDALFQSGSSFFIYPLAVHFLEITEEKLPFPAQVVFSVPKRRFKRAVDRNLLRRRLKEAYRLNKAKFYEDLAGSNKQIVFLVSYSANSPLPYAQLEKTLVKVMQRLAANAQTTAP